MIVNKGIRIRISPNEQQIRLIEKHFGVSRWVWNRFLERRRQSYADTKKGSSYFGDTRALTQLKKQFPWLYEASAISQQHSLKNLDDAYKRFFKGKSGFPKFKSKRGEQSFTTHGEPSRIEAGRLYLPKFPEGIRFNRNIPEHTKITRITISRSATGKYYASLNVEAEASEHAKTGAEVGLDLGLKDFAVLSNGKRIKNPRHTVTAQDELKKAQQHLSRKQKGSKRAKKQRVKVAKIHEKITNARKDFHHKTSSYIVKNFDFISVEDLKIKNLVKNHQLAKHISDAGWSEFLRQLQYKSEWYGRAFTKVDRWFPSTKTCSECGVIHQWLPLKQRSWTCGSCGATHNRDLNAAINILREGKKLLGQQSPNTNTEAK